VDGFAVHCARRTFRGSGAAARHRGRAEAAARTDRSGRGSLILRPAHRDIGRVSLV